MHVCSGGRPSCEAKAAFLAYAVDSQVHGGVGALAEKRSEREGVCKSRLQRLLGHSSELGALLSRRQTETRRFRLALDRVFGQSAAPAAREKFKGGGRGGRGIAFPRRSEWRGKKN